MKTIQITFLFVLLSAATTVVALPTTYAATDSGFHSSTGGTNNGSSTEYLVGTSSFLGQEFRSFFTFDFSGRPTNSVIDSGVLRLDKGAGCNCGNLTLWSLEGSLSQRQAPGPATATFVDLGDGSQLGSGSLAVPTPLVSNGPASVDISLNALGLNAINQAFRSASSWALGATSDGLVDLIGTNLAGARLILNVVPERLAPVPAPGSLALLLLGTLGVTGARRMQSLRPRQ